MKTPISIIILTKDEEANITQCLRGVVGWADEVVVLDSRSTDRTVEIAQEAGAMVVEHAFTGYVDQRNWALRELPLKNEWVLFIDADEYPTEELKKEISQITNYQLPITNSVAGYYIKRRFIWEGRWIRHGGYYPVWILRLMRHRFARCEGMLMDEHFVVDGTVGYLKNDFLHDDRRGLADWKEKHRRYAVLKAREYWERRKKKREKGKREEDKERTRRAVRRSVYDSLPLFLRAVLYFKYVFFVRLGFLDGPKGWHFHVLHGLWYPLLIDREIIRLR